jgi:hypothetical protein
MEKTKMLSVEIRVNGLLLGLLYLKNTTEVNSKLESKYLYEYYEPEKSSLLKGNLYHSRDKGAKALVRKALSIINRISSKTP